ncbi:pyrroline-5-carboxylate reductase [Alkanindiges hydrocarboniclasticus]|uniref:Pyrroline-5-carboxylate reductase n=1 Tax=Alkanindiges hydrocarboniclasticus TaxID=1907941 RepID=A0A1S8CXW6_9GAMM|nr:pyrroline-5-carboxylate reductase [Alkanindiges hydrocarboniclasticus]ONG42039.1 pyrroline-5-carboxylate reductase [Alkanindiges hydrocarboniclasticus]
MHAVTSGQAPEQAHETVSHKIAFIGGGNMAQALIGGLLAQQFKAADITVSEPVEALHDTLRELGVKVTTDNQQAVHDARVVVLAVKPQVMALVLEPLRDQFKNQLIISIAAGVTISTLSRLLGNYPRIVRAMPNTPALIQTGASGLYATAAVETADRALATTVLQAAGLVLWVEQEQQLDAVTAVSGSGPAYFFYLMEAMIQAGQDMGLTEAQSKALTLQTALGAAKMAVNSPHSPAQLRKNVTSPNGTTQAAIEAMDATQVNVHIQQALQAAATRSAELAIALEHSSATVK